MEAGPGNRPFSLMRIEMLRSCAAEGQHLQGGQVYDLDADLAAGLIRIGRAKPAPKPPAKPKAKATAKPPKSPSTTSIT